MASGNGGQIALIKINTLYTDINSVNMWTNFSSETLEHKLAELEEGTISGNRDAPNSYKGIDQGGGDINLEPNPNAFGHFLKAWFGTHVASTITGATSGGANSGDFAGYPQMWHRFTPSQTAWDGRTYLEPYNFMVYRDVGSAWLFKQAIVPTLKLSIQAQQLVKATATIMNRKTDRIQRTAAIQSLVSSGGRPWVWDMASIEVSTTGVATAGLVAQTDFENLNITFDLPHAGVPLLDGTKLNAEFTPSDFRRVKIDGTISFRDQNDYETFIAYEQRRMRITLLNVNSKVALGNIASLDATLFLGYPGMRIHFPALKFTSWSAPIPGPNRLVANFTAKAERSDADGFSCQVELRNIVASADYTTIY